ncbi:hypothetical protein K402DRAFT_1634 [Aulographum hederae CBS 113979]|uniref:Uncharacterized protein n=1 Tax=Aulographum hederae CBS 113979 TaxID=1176131 RepID=A0A6G1HGT4_9PEZI|nr:hypothetical protein K402DRAFT_1634 [Aulographum hederae CBS 113979]
MLRWHIRPAEMNNSHSKKSACKVGNNTPLDVLSRSLRLVSHNLTTMLVSVNHLSPELFWPQQSQPLSPNENDKLNWPNLEIFEVRTSIETASGSYALLGPDENLPHQSFPGRDEAEEDLSYVLEDEDYWRLIGENPKHYFRTRPEHEYFNLLAVAIAKAASQMPKLKLLTFKMSADERKDYEFRYLTTTISSRSFPSRFPYASHPDDDGDDYGFPRTEWMFGCGQAQLMGWKQPLEATKLWKEKCGDVVDNHIVTWEFSGRMNLSSYLPEQGHWRRTRDPDL